MFGCPGLSPASAAIDGCYGSLPILVFLLSSFIKMCVCTRGYSYDSDCQYFGIKMSTYSEMWEMVVSSITRFTRSCLSEEFEQVAQSLTRLQICTRYIFRNKATDGTYGSKYRFPGFGFDSGPNLQPCRNLRVIILTSWWIAWLFLVRESKHYIHVCVCVTFSEGGL